MFRDPAESGVANVSFPDLHAIPGWAGSTGGNVPINKLYVTLMNAVGCTDNGGKVTKFGVMDGTNATAGISNPGEVAGLTSAG